MSSRHIKKPNQNKNLALTSCCFFVHFFFCSLYILILWKITAEKWPICFKFWQKSPLWKNQSIILMIWTISKMLLQNHKIWSTFNIAKYKREERKKQMYQKISERITNTQNGGCIPFGFTYNIDEELMSSKLGLGTKRRKTPKQG